MNKTDGRVQVNQMSVACPCGQRLVLWSDFDGNHIQCPACKQVISIARPLPLNGPVPDDRSGFSGATFKLLWTLLGVIALVAVAFVVLYSRAVHRSRTDAANRKLTLAVTAAQEWMAKGLPSDGETAERELSNAISDQDTTIRSTAEPMLDQVRQRREEYAKKAETRQAQQRATAVLVDAKRLLDANRISDAINQLEKYVADPNASERTQADRLLAEARIAVSDEATLNALVAMNASSFERARASSQIEDGKVFDPTLLTARAETIRRNFGQAARKREEINAAEERRREDARIAEEERLKAVRLAEVAREREGAERRQAELARERAAEEARRAEVELLRNPPAVSFKDLVNFPEDYMEKPVKVSGVWFHGDLNRQEKQPLFAATVESDDGKYALGHLSLMERGLNFVVSENFGRALDLAFEARSKTRTNLCCVISKIGDAKIAKIYRIEVLNLSGGVVRSLEDEKPRD